MKSKTYTLEITNQKNEKYLSEGRNPLACLPPRLLVSCQLKNFPREFTEKCFAVFDQSRYAIYLTWYRSFLFFWESINTASNSLSKIKELRIGNANKVIIGNLNINSIRNKFEQLKKTVLKYIDILVVTETKLDETFLESLFLMDGFSKPYKLDRNKNGGGVMIFIRDTISSKILEKHIFPNDVESIFVELNFRKCKWLLCGTYHPPSQSDEYFFNNFDKALDTYSKYDKVLLVGDLTQKYRHSA